MMTQKTIRNVILADDHALVRDGLRALLRDVEGIRVVADARNGIEVLEQVRRVRPDGVLLDINMPGMNGLDVADLLTRRHPGVTVLMVSHHAEPEIVARAFKAGAAGYVHKESAFSELVEALRSVFAGRRYLSRSIDAARVRRAAGQLEKGGSELDLLTRRQRQILQLLSEGLGTRAIAERLCLSVKTVETHRSHLMRRLGIDNLPDLVRLAIRSDLVPLEC